MSEHTYVLVPVYNDWACVDRLLVEIENVFKQLQARVSVCLIDDCSQSTPSFLDRPDSLNFQHIEQIHYIRLIRNVGHQSAIAIGLSWLLDRQDCRRAIVMDADGEDKPSDIPALLQVAGQNGEQAQIVFARRRQRPGVGFRFRMSYLLYRALAGLLTGRNIDFGNFSVVPGRCLKTLTRYSELWRHFPATVLLSKLPYRSVPCDRGQRYTGRSQMSWASLVIHGLQSISLFSQQIAARMFLACGFLLAPLLACLLVVISLRMFSDLPIPGWATYAAGLLVVMILQVAAMVLFFAFVILTAPRQQDLSSPPNFGALIESVRELREVP